MKGKIFFLILLFLVFVFTGICQMKTIYLKDFGAIANDAKSDQEAFYKVADYINKRGGNVKLIISSGKYIVGPDIKPGANPIQTGILWDVVNLKNCTNVSIEGKGKVLIKYYDNIPFGGLAARADNKDTAVHIGSLFRFTNVTNISISNLEANGNNNKFKLLHTWGVGQNPYEREHEGLFLLNCQNVQVNDVSFNNFGRDGCMILQDPEGIPVKNISFINCNFNNNGRDGLSWLGGENLKLYKCSFNNNCRGIIQTNPGSGMDIEPERRALCKKGSIVKCNFINNGGYAITSGYFESSDVFFDSCTIIGNSNYAMLISSPKYFFKNCKIAGTSLVSYDADTDTDATYFLNCVFTDSVATQKIHTFGYIIAVLGRHIKFDACTFTGYNGPVLFTEIKKKKAANDNENTLFKKCTFNAFFTKPSTWQQHAFLLGNCNFTTCIFKTKGYADFKFVLEEPFRNIYQDKNIFLTVK